MRLLLLLTGWVLLTVAGCSRKTTASTSEVKDSTGIKIEYRDVPVLVPGETIKSVEYIECDSTTNKPIPKEFEAAGNRSKLKGSIDKNGKMQQECTCDSLNLVVKAMDKEIFRLRHESKTQTETKIEYKTRTIDMWARTICLLEIIALAGYVFYKLNRIRL